MSEPPFRTVAIIGLGLIGGSLARDLAQSGIKVLGYDRDDAIARRAERDGVLTALSQPEASGSAEAVIIAVPIDEALSLLPSIAASLEGVRLVTDVCSTKASIVRAADEIGLARVFVGSHPMAGDHRSGWEASRTGLFANARTYICPTDSSAEPSIALAERLWQLLGASTERIDAESHDREVAWTSHLPHLASAALAGVLTDAGIGRNRLGPGGRDVTRLAASDPQLWTTIALDNAAPLERAIEAFEGTLGGMREALARRDRASLHRQFALAREWSQRS